MSNAARTPVHRLPPRRGRGPRLALLLLVVAAAVLITSRFQQQPRVPSSPPVYGPLTISFFDVGPGNSTLIQTPGGKAILVNTGPASARRALFADLGKCGVRHLDLLMTTHADSAHAGNTLAVLQRFPTASTMVSGLETLSPAQQARQQEMARHTLRGVPLLASHLARSRLALGGGAMLEYLGPLDRFPHAEDNGIVFRISVGRIKVLLTGDEGPLERDSLLTHVLDLRSTILEVSQPATRVSLRFLGSVQPHAIIFTTSADHPDTPPASPVAQAIRYYGIQTTNVARHGNLTFQTDGNTYHLFRWAK